MLLLEYQNVTKITTNPGWEGNNFKKPLQSQWFFKQTDEELVQKIDFGLEVSNKLYVIGIDLSHKSLLMIQLQLLKRGNNAGANE